MDLPDFLTRTPAGDIDLTGHRIGLYTVVRYFTDGESAEMIAARFPTLPLALVYKTIGFYLDNRAAADDYGRAYRAELDRQESAAPPSNRAALRGRAAELRQGA